MKLRFLFPLLALLLPARALADDGVPLAPWHAGVTPLIGGGVAAMDSGGTFPKLVGLSTFGGEIDLAFARLGLFGRVMFMSSGADGRWTGWSYTLGPSYRLFGDGYERPSLVLRAGLTYERWSAQTSGCAVILFFPNSCSNIPAPPMPGIVTGVAPTIEIDTDTLGVVAGARLELPIKPLYLALDAELAGVTSLEAGAPGQIIELRGALVIGFRQRRSADYKGRPNDPRLPHGSTF